MKIYVVAAPERDAVPDVAGRSEADARAVLEAAGFQVTITRQETDEYPDGTVIRTMPAAGEDAEVGTLITVIIATPPMVEVPDIIGERALDVIADLDDFDVKTRNVEPTASCAINRVCATDPAAGTKVPKGSVLWIDVATPGPATSSTTTTTTTDPGGGD